MGRSIPISSFQHIVITVAQALHVHLTSSHFTSSNLPPIASQPLPALIANSSLSLLIPMPLRVPVQSPPWSTMRRPVRFPRRAQRRPTDIDALTCSPRSGTLDRLRGVGGGIAGGGEVWEVCARGGLA